MAVSSLKNKSKLSTLTAPFDIDLGGMIPISSFTATSNTTTVTFSDIPQSYEHLQIRYYARTDRNVSDGDWITFRLNGISTNDSYYSGHYMRGNGTNTFAAANGTASQIFIERVPGLNTLSNVMGIGIIDLLDYTNTNKNKVIRHIGGYDANGDTSASIRMSSGMLLSTPAVTSVTLTPGEGPNFISGSSFGIYGIKRAGA